MNIQLHNTNHCMLCERILHKKVAKHIKSDKHFLITGEKTESKRCKIKHTITDYEDHLNSEKH